ncbi:MAG: hypothetical protein AAGF94_06660 [Pseudomonadota bacterium]
MSKGTYIEFRDALRAFESGWDRDRYDAGIIQDWQLNAWAGTPGNPASVTDFFPGYSSWGDLTDAEWDAMSYRSMNSIGFVGYQFGEALLIDLGYYQDDFFYGNGASTNTWDGTWTGKNGVNSLDDFMSKSAQEQAIQEAFGYNTQVIVNGLANQGLTLDDYIGTTRTYLDNGVETTVTLSMTGILAAAHLRGAWGTLNLLLNDSVSVDEYGTSILRYIDQFGGYDSPSTEEIIQVWDASYEAQNGNGGGDNNNTDNGNSDTGNGNSDGSDTGGGGIAVPPNGTIWADVTKETADVVITWAWGSSAVISDFDPASDTIFVDWISANDLVISETADGIVFAVPSNNQTLILANLALSDLSTANFTVLDATAQAEIAVLVSDGSGDSGDGDMGNGDVGDGDHGGGDMDGGGHGGGDMDGGHGGHEHQHIYINLNTPAQTIDGFMPAMGDMIEVEGDVTTEYFSIFEESGDALGQTVRIEITQGGETKQIIFTGFGLDDLGLGNITAVNEGVQNEIAATLGSVVITPGDGEGYNLTYDNDGSTPPATTGATDAGGVKYKADSNADDIVGFDPATDELDFGGTSVHGMIVTKSEAGEIVIDSPWSDAAQIVQGVTYQDVTIDNFGVVGNEHFRQDIGGVVSWEQGIGPRAADTVYLRSHEYGVHEVIEGFDPTADKISLLYFGTRERLLVEDTQEGLVISSLPSGQSFTFTGVTKAELIPGLVEFHFDQFMEDNLETPFGFDENDVTLVDRTILLTPEAPAGDSTDGAQTRTGDLTGSIYEGTAPSDGDDTSGGSDGGTGGGSTPGGGAETALTSGADTVELGWSYGSTETFTGFDPALDVIDFKTFSAGQLAITEQNGDLVIEVLNNGGDFTVLAGLQAEDLSSANLTAPGWSDILDANSALMQQLTALGYDDVA